MRKRAIFWRWVAISRSRRVRNDSSRLRASEALADWLWAAASAASAWATSAGSVRKAVARRVRSSSTACSFTRFSICASIRDCKSTAWGGYEENGAAQGMLGFAVFYSENPDQRNTQSGERLLGHWFPCI